MNTEILLGAVALSGYVVAGVFAFRGQWDAASKQKREEADKLADGLITRLQQTVEQQSKDLETMKGEMDRHTKERNAEVQQLRDDLKHLQGRNSVLEDLFKGRDPAMQSFFKDAPKLFDMAETNHGLINETNAEIKNLAQTLAKFVDAIQPVLIHAELMKPPREAVQ